MKQKKVFRGHKESVTCSTFSTSKQLFSGDLAGNVICWDLDIGRPLYVLEKIHGHSILNIHIFKENTLISQGRDGFVKWTDLETKKEVRKSKSLQYTFCKFACDEDSILVIEDGQVIALMSIETGKVIGRLKGIKENDKVESEAKNKLGMVLCMDLKYGRAFCGYEGGSVTIHEKKNLEIWKILRGVHFLKPILSVVAHKNLVITGGATTKIVIMNTESAKIAKEYEIPTAKEGVNEIKTDHHRLFVTGGWDKMVRVYDLKRHKPLTILKFHTESVNTVDIMRCGEKQWMICTGSKDKRVVVWKVSFKKKTSLIPEKHEK